VDALNAFKGVLRKNANDVDALAGAAEAALALGQFGDSRRYCEQALQANHGCWQAHFVLGDIYRQQGGFDAAQQCYQNVLHYKQDHAVASYYLGNMLKTQGQPEAAIACYDQAIQKDPELVEAYWNSMRVLPVIVDDEAQISESRKRYAQGLETLRNSLELDTQEGRKQALRGLNASTNFYLQYQGMDDLSLQRSYGEIVQKTMAANFPQWSVPLARRVLQAGQRVRVGYCSAYLRDHNGANWLLGWLRHRDHKQFEIFCYHTGARVDGKTDEFRSRSDHFRHIYGDLHGVCEQIAADKLDILVYPELGMDPQSMMMAGLRLAPVQCVGWGHPVTSGMTTMDYWLSSDLMEPVNGQEHYLETLVRLPNMANCYSGDQRRRVSAGAFGKSRQDFGLPDDAVLYFCSQSLFKYLPRYDYLWVEIANNIPDARFVFLAISSVHVVKRFMARIEKVFSEQGLKAAAHCIMLNRQSPDDYLNLNLLMDVFLDNLPWSGNNTSLAAVDCALPIVTLPTDYMRGRHASGILKMMGVEETIAGTPQEYIDIAVRLGTDPDWNRRIRKRIEINRDHIYEDRNCVQYLEHFYKEAGCHRD
jgi:predicted O-linked N-acetylglucosamine transferase (SPINDLY family)